jgi:TolB protein
VKNKARFLTAVVLAGAVAIPAAAQDEVYLKVTSPGLTRVMIAMPNPSSRPGVDPAAAATLVSTLRQDLDQTAVVGLVPEENASLVVVDPNNPTLTRQRWRAVGAQFLLDGTISGTGNQIVLEVRLWDLTSGEIAYSRRLQGAVSLAPTIAHTLANELVHLFTGRPGPFLSRIAFVSDRTGAKEIWLMRWDGTDAQQLTSHRSIALGPAWSPDGEWLAFTSFLRGSPQLFILRPTEGYLKPLSTLPGVNSSPSFSPDGKQVAFATGANGNTDIYVVPATGGTPERLTHTLGISTQPAWSPNGRQIVFTSTLGGSPQLYIMDAEGTNVRRLTFDAKFADEAAWAPDGVRLTYTTLVENHFQIAIMDLRTDTRAIVSGPGNNESPCWSPDGTMLAFVSDRTGSRQIFITDPAGHPRQITSEGNNVAPAWVAHVQ